jgi:hypothetical protein
LPPARRSRPPRTTTRPSRSAAGLALLALGGAALALSRRRRRYDEEAWADEESAYDEPAIVHDEQPAIVAPAASAFAWGDRAERDESAASTSDDGSDRRPGESWVERAYRGPSPANPSASLKNRLRRAAFFDKREREVAAGRAAPVDTDAGLPERMATEERELADA